MIYYESIKNVYKDYSLSVGPNNDIVSFSHAPNISDIVSDYQNFNSPVIIGDQIRNCSHMFSDCFSFNQPVIIPNNVTKCMYMFSNCSNFSSNIFFTAQEYHSDFWISGLCYNMNNGLIKNIYFNSIFNNIFNNTWSITGASITWTPMDNGFYNSDYNIYCYNNY